MVTAGNASQQNDAAAGCLVVSEAFLKRHDLQPMAEEAQPLATVHDPSHQQMTVLGAHLEVAGGVFNALIGIDAGHLALIATFESISC